MTVCKLPICNLLEYAMSSLCKNFQSSIYCTINVNTLYILITRNMYMVPTLAMLSCACQTDEASCLYITAERRAG